MLPFSLAKAITELRLRGVEGVDVPNPLTGGQGRIGKTYDGEAWKIDAEPACLRVPRADLPAVRAHLATAVRGGELVVADADTAAALGVPMPSAPKPAPAKKEG